MIRSRLHLLLGLIGAIAGLVLSMSSAASATVLAPYKDTVLFDQPKAECISTRINSVGEGAMRLRFGADPMRGKFADNFGQGLQVVVHTLDDNQTRAVVAFLDDQGPVHFSGIDVESIRIEFSADNRVVCVGVGDQRGACGPNTQISHTLSSVAFGEGWDLASGRCSEPEFVAGLSASNLQPWDYLWISLVAWFCVILARAYLPGRLKPTIAMAALSMVAIVFALVTMAISHWETRNAAYPLFLLWASTGLGLSIYVVGAIWGRLRHKQPIAVLPVGAQVLFLVGIMFWVESWPVPLIAMSDEIELMPTDESAVNWSSFFAMHPLMLDNHLHFRSNYSLPDTLDEEPVRNWRKRKPYWVVTGSSVIYGRDVDGAQTLVANAERALRARGITQPLLNWGVEGATIGQINIMLRRNFADFPIEGMVISSRYNDAVFSQVSDVSPRCAHGVMFKVLCSQIVHPGLWREFKIQPVIMFLRWMFNDTAGEFQVNFDEIIERQQELGREFLVLDELSRADSGGNKAGVFPAFEDLHVVQKQTAIDYDLPYYSGLEEWEQLDPDVVLDGFAHLSVEGHEVVGRWLADFVQPYMSNNTVATALSPSPVSAAPASGAISAPTARP